MILHILIFKAADLFLYNRNYSGISVTIRRRKWPSGFPIGCFKIQPHSSSLAYVLKSKIVCMLCMSTSRAAVWREHAQTVRFQFTRTCCCAYPSIIDGPILHTLFKSGCLNQECDRDVYIGHDRATCNSGERMELHCMCLRWNSYIDSNIPICLCMLVHEGFRQI
jgi:hypothetical protein